MKKISLILLPLLLSADVAMKYDKGSESPSTIEKESDTPPKLKVMEAEEPTQEEEVESFEKIEVEGSQYIQKQDFLQHAPMQKQITTKEALDIPGTNGDPIKAIKTFAGVTSTDNDNAEMIIHGSKPRETRFEINTLPLGYVFHLGGLHSVISPEATKQIDAYLGAFDVSYYGMGAVIDVTPEYPTGDNHGKVHIGMYDADINADVKITDNISLFISARRSYFDLFAAKIMDSLDEEGLYTFTLFPQFYDGNFMLNANFGNHMFTLEAITSQDDLKLNSEEESAKDPVAHGKIEQSIGFTSYGTRWVYFGESFTANTLLYRMDSRSQLDLYDNDYYVKESPTEQGLHHKTTFEMTNHRPTLGFHMMQNISPVDLKIFRPPTSGDISYIASSENVITLNKTYYAEAYVLYAQDIWSLTDNLHLRYGVRGWNTVFQEYGTDYNPRGAIVYDMNEHLSLSLAAGQYSQLPQTTYIIDQFGNPQIDTYENSNHYALNLNATFLDSSSLVIEPYYKSFNALVISDGSSSYEAVGEGEAYGVDVTYTKKMGDISIVGAYTYVQAKRELYSDDDTWYRFYGEIPNTFQLSSSYTFGQSGWQVSGLFKYSDGKPYTPLVKGDDGKYYTQVPYDRDDESNILYYNAANYGEPWSERLPSTYDLDLKISWIKKHSTYFHEEFSLELLNLTSLWYKNISAIKYSDAYEEDGYYYQMSFFPAFHYTVRF